MRSTTEKYEATDITLNNSAQNLGSVQGRQMEFEAEFVVDRNAEQGFRFLKDGNNYASLFYQNGKLTFDISNLAKIDNVDKYNTYVSDLNLANGQILKLHI